MRNLVVGFLSISMVLGYASAQVPGGAAGKAPSQSKAQKSAADPNRELALRLLEEAEADSGVLDAAGRAGVQFLAGQAYASVDKAKARILLQSAYENALVAYEERQEAVAFMLPDVAAATVKVAPETVEQSLPANDSSRDYALRLLIKYHIARKDMSRAVELLQMMRSDGDITYGAIDLLAAIPAAHQDERDQIFAIVFRAYKSTKHYQVGTGRPEDLGTLVVRFHQSISHALVREAIDELLSQAKSIGVRVEMSTPDRSDTFDAYQFRLFQLLPALRELDPEKADFLLKEDADTAALLKRYPDGQAGVDQRFNDGKEKESQTLSYKIADDNSRMLQTTGTFGRPVETKLPLQRDPYTAIAQAAQEADGAARTKRLLEIAQTYRKSNANAARAALRQLRAHPPGDPNLFWRVLDAVKIAQELGDRELANSLIELGLKEARDLYDDESNKDNPNTALKLNWVSTRAYREILSIQIKVATDSALQALTDLPDTEIRALENVAVAAALLNADLPKTSPYMLRAK